MAYKIGVLEHYENLSDRPRRDMKRSVALFHLQRGLADKIMLDGDENGRWVIQMRPPTTRVACREIRPIPRRYIPTEMPWAELPGIVVEGSADNEKRFFVLAANQFAKRVTVAAREIARV